MSGKLQGGSAHEMAQGLEIRHSSEVAESRSGLPTVAVSGLGLTGAEPVAIT